MYYNVTDAPFTNDMLDAILALDKAGMLDADSATEILGGVKPEPTIDAHDAKMATLKPSNGQMRRVNALYREAGLREFATLASFRNVFATMLDASVEYRTMKAAR